MISMLQSWKGAVEIDGTQYKSIQDAMSVLKTFSDDIHIKLLSEQKNANKSVVAMSESVSNECQITVKAYMTRKATPEFDFMAKWNNDKPMPMRVMQGTVEKETPGMVYMKLHGLAKPTVTCYCCGKELTNPISRHYGIGPICLSKLGIDYEIDDIENIKEELVNIEWEGWIIKSAITKKEEIKEKN